MRPTRILAAIVALLAAPVAAQPADHDLMVVFDASNSMWGQIEGRPKIDIAREALSDVLAGVDPGTRLGLMVYGAERRGDCGDIALRVPVAPAADAAAQIADVAAGVTPRGKTPLTDAVRQAAEALRYTENRATVVLITDGVESCEADPCALGRALAADGIDFTAHVVGFGLTDSEGQEVACLAEATGGLYLPAADAGALTDALGRTLAPIPASDADFTTPAPPAGQSVDLILRDAAGSTVLNARSFDEVTLTGPEGEVVPVDLSWEREISGTATLTPGLWLLDAQRRDDDGTATGYAVAGLPVEIAPDTASVELILQARLTVETQLWPGEVLAPGTEVPSSSGDGRANYALHLMVDGRMAEDPVATGTMGFDAAVAPGDYVLRGTLGRLIARDLPVTVRPGVAERVVFDFAVAPVQVFALTPDGQRVTRAGGRPQTTYPEPDTTGDAMRKAGAPEDAKGNPRPLYLPVGAWVIDVGAEGGGDARSKVLVEVTAPGVPVVREVPAGTRLTAEEIARADTPGTGDCAAKLPPHGACLIASDPGGPAKPSRPRDAAATGDATKGAGVEPPATDARAPADPVAPPAGTVPVTLSRDGLTVDLPWGDAAFADRAMRIDAGDRPVADANLSPDNLLGPPEARGGAFTALGCHGDVVAWFDDVQAIDGQGVDLVVMEGGGRETMELAAITADGGEVGLGLWPGGAMAIDLAQAGIAGPVSGLRMVDMGDDCGNRTPGGDIWAVAVVNGVPAAGVPAMPDGAPAADPAAPPATGTTLGFTFDGLMAATPEIPPGLYGFEGDVALCAGRSVRIGEGTLDIGYADGTEASFACTADPEGQLCTSTAFRRDGQVIAGPEATLGLAPLFEMIELCQMKDCADGRCEVDTCMALVSCDAAPGDPVTPPAAGSPLAGLAGVWSEGDCDLMSTELSPEGRLRMLSLGAAGWIESIAADCVPDTAGVTCDTPDGRITMAPGTGPDAALICADGDCLTLARCPGPAPRDAVPPVPTAVPSRALPQVMRGPFSIDGCAAQAVVILPDGQGAMRMRSGGADDWTTRTRLTCRAEGTQALCDTRPPDGGAASGQLVFDLADPAHPEMCDDDGCIRLSVCTPDPIRDRLR